MVSAARAAVESDLWIKDSFKKWAIPGLFFFIFRIFYKQLTVNVCSIIVADDWIRTRVLVLEATALPTAPHRCPKKITLKLSWVVLLSTKNTVSNLINNLRIINYGQFSSQYNSRVINYDC